MVKRKKKRRKLKFYTLKIGKKPMGGIIAGSMIGAKKQIKRLYTPREIKKAKIKYISYVSKKRKKRR